MHGLRAIPGYCGVKKRAKYDNNSNILVISFGSVGCFQLCHDTVPGQWQSKYIVLQSLQMFIFYFLILIVSFHVKLLFSLQTTQRYHPNQVCYTFYVFHSNNHTAMLNYVSFSDAIVRIGASFSEIFKDCSKELNIKER